MQSTSVHLAAFCICWDGWEEGSTGGKYHTWTTFRWPKTIIFIVLLQCWLAESPLIWIKTPQSQTRSSKNASESETRQRPWRSGLEAGLGLKTNVENCTTTHPGGKVAIKVSADTPITAGARQTHLGQCQTVPLKQLFVYFFDCIFEHLRDNFEKTAA